MREEEIFSPFIEAIGHLKRNYLLPLLVVGWAPPQLFLQEVFGELWDYRSLQINKDLMDVEGNQRQTSAGSCQHYGTVICLLQALLLGATGCLFLCHLLTPLLLLSPSNILPTVPPPRSSVSWMCIYLTVWVSLLMSCFHVLGFPVSLFFSDSVSLSLYYLF